ncbi:MAG: TlpA family protein disulfide reductase [Acidobacteriota bacterium]|nr:TlpA family protein disulfide reductase [Acidobacteriota bacterium]
MLAITIGACSTKKSDDTTATPVLSAQPNTTYPMPPLKADSEMGWVANDGRRARLADYQGKLLVLDFYATWCLPCRQSIPRLNALEQRYGPKGVQVIGLNVGGADDRIKVPAFARELGIQYPLGFPDKALTDLFLSDNPTIPQTFVFGRNGQLVKRFIGYDEATGTELEKIIGELVGKQQTVNSKQ